MDKYGESVNRARASVCEYQLCVRGMPRLNGELKVAKKLLPTNCKLFTEECDVRMIKICCYASCPSALAESTLDIPDFLAPIVHYL